MSMKIIAISKYILITVLLIISCSSCRWFENSFESRWALTPDRVWVGADYWANRLQDWRIHDGRLECIGSNRSLRTVHLLTQSLGPVEGHFSMRIETGLLSEKARRAGAYAGFLIGAGSPKDDYRLRALVHQAHGKNGGIITGINGRGQLVVMDNENKRKPLNLERDGLAGGKRIPAGGVRLNLKARLVEGEYKLILHALDLKSGKTLDSAYVEGISRKRLHGNIALAVHVPDTSAGQSFWFKKWKIHGPKIVEHPDRAYGPILGTHYTISRQKLHMTAQLPPLSKQNHQRVKLEIRQKGEKDWKQAARSPIKTPGYTAAFHIDNWNSTEEWYYRLSYPLQEQNESSWYKGTIPKEPTGDLVLAGLQNQALLPESFGEEFNFSKDSLWFPHRKLIRNLERHQPDMILYSGNQVNRAYPVRWNEDKPHQAYLDYLYRWYLFCWANQELSRNIPSLILPAPQDLYQDSLWGGTDLKQPEIFQAVRGGYKMPAPFINMVQRTQAGHLPPPYDPSPNQQGIPALYTDLVYGGIGFAFVEARKFKSPPNPSPSEGYNPKDLFGARQLQFLREWTKDWSQTEMKVVISQEALSCLYTQTPPAMQKEKNTAMAVFPKDRDTLNLQKAKNRNTNGWPSAGRNKALREVRKGHALMITAGNNPAHLIQHGIKNWSDASYAFGLPQATPQNNRGWYLTDTAHTLRMDRIPYTGNFRDGFNNLISIKALTNPIRENQPGQKPFKGTGFGTVRFNHSERRATLAVWPLSDNPVYASPHEGWPVSIQMQNNYHKPEDRLLPQILTRGLTKKPVFMVYPAHQDRLIYARRANDSIFQPRVFENTFYNLIVGAPEEKKMDTLKNLKPVRLKKHIILDFRDQ